MTTSQQNSSPAKSTDEELQCILAETPPFAYAANYANSAWNPKLPSLRIHFAGGVDPARAREVVEALAAAVKARLSPWRGEKLRARRISDRRWALELDAIWSGDADEDMGDAVCMVAEIVQAVGRD